MVLFLIRSPRGLEGSDNRLCRAVMDVKHFGDLTLPLVVDMEVVDHIQSVAVADALVARCHQLFTITLIIVSHFLILGIISILCLRLVIERLALYLFGIL
jgi:hypothetical protein